jgi:CheY-like chemotaxis protein
MPAMKGDELAMTIKARTPGQPVVLITAYAEMLKASRHPLTGVDFIISKPFLLENLREAINKATSSSASSGAKS